MFKKALPYIGVVAFFAAISLMFFHPQLKGEKLATHDQKQWKGGAQENKEIKEETGEFPLWSNSMFAGMPAYYVYFPQPDNLINTYIKPIFTLGLERPALYIVWALLSFFFLAYVLKIPWPIAVMGSIGYAFSTYTFIVLEAGHFAKVVALGFLPALFAGALLIKQKKYLMGFTVTGLLMSFEITANHPQMTYYFFIFFLAIYFLLELIEQVKKKETKAFFVWAGLFAGAVVLGVLPSSTQLLTTQEYTPYSTRGQSELTAKADQADQTTGLDRSYINMWSNGIDETWQLLIPNAKGGASGAISNNKKALEAVNPRFRQNMSGVDSYWGDQPFVGGPMYAGAVIMLLFVLGLFVLDGTLKNAIIISSVFTVVLSWGGNFSGFTDLFVDYFPMYNKFRAVASIQTVALFAIPLLATLALYKLITEKELLKQPLVIFGKKTKYTNAMALYASFILTGGIAAIFGIAPDVFFDFYKSGELQNLTSQLKSAGFNAAQTDGFLEAVETARRTLFTADAWRTFGLTAVALLILVVFSRGSIKGNMAAISMAVLVLLDMWSVNQRYVDVEAAFEPAKKVDVPFVASAADLEIQKDPTHFRVLNVSVSTFNETGTSFFHNSMGGYSGAKLKKYQELVDNYIGNEIGQIKQGMQQVQSFEDVGNLLRDKQVLNMFNTKYIIYNPGAQPLMNQQAFGNAWFAKNIAWVESADDEMAGLGKNDLRTTAVVRRDQEAVLGGESSYSGEGTITLAQYGVDEMVYSSNSSEDQLAVFSEVWYPEGWTAYIDGEVAEIARVNYTLRGLKVPAGQHEIVFEFAPSSYATGVGLAYAGSAVLLLLILGTVFMEYKNAQSSKEAS